jgi:hypothetical protein
MSQIDVSLSVHVTSASAKLSPFLRQKLVGTNYHLWEASLRHPCGPASPDLRYLVLDFAILSRRSSMNCTARRESDHNHAFGSRASSAAWLDHRCMRLTCTRAMRWTLSARSI